MAKRLARLGLCLVALAAACSMASGADWQPHEKIETYAVSGTSGPALYASIGQRGPQVGGSGRAIAYTHFKLTWSRDYQPRGGGCTIVSARPKLIITYTLPKAADALSGVTLRNWEVFTAGVREHEKVHGKIIEEMVRKIEAYSVGLSVADDPKCSKIRKVLTERLTQLSLEQRQRSRDFDRDELGNNGNIQQLVLMLVNGG
jgi:predicted secreted Zn-dependent protease